MGADVGSYVPVQSLGLNTLPMSFTVCFVFCGGMHMSPRHPRLEGIYRPRLEGMYRPHFHKFVALVPVSFKVAAKKFADRKNRR
jgi:hypothetical protein